MEVGVVMDLAIRTMITAIMVAAPILLVSILKGSFVFLFVISCEFAAGKV